MKIPNLPTDSLYKFMALFGLIFSLASGYLYYEQSKLVNDRIRADSKEKAIDRVTTDQIFRKILNSKAIPRLSDSLPGTEEEMVQMFKLFNQVDSISLGSQNPDSIKILRDFKIRENQALLRRDTNLRDASLIAFFAGILLSTLGFILWYGKVQIFEDKIIKNEADKLDLDKNIYVHELQFKKEFQIYEEIWPVLESLKNKLRKVYGIGMSQKATKTPTNKEIGAALKTFSELSIPINSNRPFLPPNIYTLIKSFGAVTLPKGFKIEDRDVDDPFRIWVEQMPEKLEAIMHEIHKRMGLLTVIEK